MEILTIKDFVKESKSKIKKICEKSRKKIKLTVIQVNDDQASNTYVKGKLNDCTEVGIESNLIKLDQNTSESELISLIKYHEQLCDGIIVQLPLPEHINEDNIKLAINPNKDVDGFNPATKFNACTPGGIIEYLDYLAENLMFDYTGRNAVVIGRSNIVGRPMANLLLKKNMNVTILHSKTPEDLKRDFIAKADLIVVATGHTNTLTSNYKYKESCVIIDVGINRDQNNKLIGDCERNLPVKYQSPVPGGVGLLTRLKLLENVIDAHYLKRN